MRAQWRNEAKLCEARTFFFNWKGILASFGVFFWYVLPKKLNLLIVRSCVHDAQSPNTTCEILLLLHFGLLVGVWTCCDCGINAGMCCGCCCRSCLDTGTQEAQVRYQRVLCKSEARWGLRLASLWRRKRGREGGVAPAPKIKENRRQGDCCNWVLRVLVCFKKISWSLFRSVWFYLIFLCLGLKFA